jgi:acetyl esterase
MIAAPARRPYAAIFWFGGLHDRAARSRDCPNHSTAAAARSRDLDAPERPGLASGARRIARGGSAAVTDVFGNYADTKENARFPSRSENAEGYFLSRAVMEWFAGHYLADRQHGSDWRVSPLRAKDLSGLAPAVVCTAWFDPLRDEGRAYADALAAADVRTTYHHGAGLIHGYFGLGEASETARFEAQRARADFKAMLNRGL